MIVAALGLMAAMATMAAPSEEAAGKGGIGWPPAVRGEIGLFGSIVSVDVEKRSFALQAELCIPYGVDPFHPTKIDPSRRKGILTSSATRVFGQQANGYAETVLDPAVLKTGMRVLVFGPHIGVGRPMTATRVYPASCLWESADLMPRAPLESGKASWDRPLFGVIRWDIFSGGDSTTNPELKSLSPRKYHDRVPFFLMIESENKVAGSENKQRVIDRQIAYARSAGIDYWAFVTCPEMDPNGAEYYALHRLLKSECRAGIRFCVIIHKYDNRWERRVSRFVELFKDSSYLKVTGNRPLLYVFSIADMERQYGSMTKRNIELLVNASVAAGLGRPYIALMSGSASCADKVREYGVDALSSYANTEGQGTTFASLARSDVEKWEAFSRTGVKLIPLVSAGWNLMPRIDNPPPWGASSGGRGTNFDLPQPEEIATHIREGLSFVVDHRDICDANSILVYAWNEFCEGGWLCPTYGDGARRLESIRSMLETYKVSE